MIDINILRNNPKIIKDSLVLRGQKPEIVDELIKKDNEFRNKQFAFDELRVEQKQRGKEVALTKDAKEKQRLIKSAKELSNKVQISEQKLQSVKKEFNTLMYKVPNIVQGAPKKNVVLESRGVKPIFSFKVLSHDKIGEELDIIDTKRGTKVSGTRFYFLKGLGALLEQALLRLAIKTAVKYKFIPMVTPTLVLPNTIAGMGFLDEHDDEVFKLERDNLYLSGTSEVALGGYYANEILTDLPIRLSGISTCYRREAGSYGKDTKGIFRVHQFNKIEMFSYCKQEDADSEHKKFLEIEKEILDKLNLHYRVVDIAANDLGSSAARKFDCEAWIPSQNAYRELTSTSNCTTFQAKRLNIREKRENENASVATVNGTLVTTRFLVAILENYQNKQGQIDIPDVLKEFI
jgi:seryl-tRNA synthetase